MKSNKSILVVDDNKDVSEAMSHILSEAGYEVRESGSGTDALAVFRTDPFPLVITDFLMDDMSGIELLAKIKKIRPETEVILLTGYASAETATAALRNGAFDYIIKTYDNLCLLPEVVSRAGEKFQRAEEQRTLLESLIKKNAELELANRRFSETAAFDESTGLYNSSHFQKVLEGEVARSVYSKSKFSLVFFTVDCINWKKDPEWTDISQLFSDVTGSIKQRLRRSDILARYAENVFAILLPETAREGARCVVANMYQIVASGSTPSLQKWPSGDIEVIAEVAVFAEDGIDGAELVRHALDALKAKKGQSET
jgi:diguanylate cyclase (GGDEF)-like protein